MPRGWTRTARRAASTWGIEGALTVNYRLGSPVTVSLGWSGQTVDTDLSRGHYLSGGTTWQVTPQLGLDIGGRVGLDDGAPAYDMTAGLTVAALPAW